MSDFERLPSEPDAFTASFGKLFNSGDLEALAQIFEADAVVHLQDGRVARGIDEIRQVLAGFLALGLPMSLEQGYCVVNGDYALNSAHWCLDGRTRDGQDVRMEGRTCDLIHRGADGRWRHAIDNPFGTSVARP